MHSTTAKPALSIFILTLCALSVLSQVYLPIPLTSEFSHYFLIAPSQAIWVGSSFAFAYAVGFLVFGPLSDRFGRKAILVPGLIVLGILTIGVGFSENFTMLIVLRILQGFVAATFTPIAIAYLSEQLPTEMHATGIACFSTGLITAGVLGQLYAMSMLSHFHSWQYIFRFSGVVYFIFSALIAYFLRENKQLVYITQNKQGLLSCYANIFRHLKNKTLVVSYSCAFVLLMTFVAMYTGLASFLIAQFHFHPQKLFDVRAFGLIGMGVAPFAGILIKRFGRKTVFTTGFLLSAAAIILEGSSPSVMWVVISSILFVAGIAGSAPALIQTVALTAARGKASAISLYLFILFSGAAIGPLLATAADPHGFKMLAMIICSVLIIAVVLFVSIVKKSESVVIQAETA